jgi:hypothetical protein
MVMVLGPTKRLMGREAIPEITVFPFTVIVDFKLAAVGVTVTDETVLST